MDIFNGNRRLEELTMHGIDWGTFLRHDMEGGIAPFIFLQNEDEKKIIKLMTEENPMEFAKKILEEEEFPFEQFVIGFEGYLRDDDNNKTDAIIVQGFDITQPKGVALGQMFNPKENGGFRKIDNTIFIDNPDLIIEQKTNSYADYSVEEIGFNAMAFTDNYNLTTYMVVISSDNSTVIANTIKIFLRSKFSEEKSKTLSGAINFIITDSNNEDFLTFLITNSINEQLESENIKNWQIQNNRKVVISCKIGDNTIYENTGLDTEKNTNANNNIKTTSTNSSPKNENTKKWWEFWK